MAIPTFDKLFNPLLTALKKLGGSGSISEIEDKVAEITSLTEEEINEIHSESRTKLSYNLAWARTYLKLYGLVQISSRGVWVLTSKGKRTKTINKKEVKKYVRKLNRGSELPEKDLETLEQLDFFEDDYIDKVFDKYSQLIGWFLIRFSRLEHDFNIIIAEFFGDDYHETGYIVIKKLMFLNKIELFYDLYIRPISFSEKNKKKQEKLLNIKKRLDDINTFRNRVVHANWSSLNRDGFVRTKIITDYRVDGAVKFERVKITPKIIKKNIAEINKLIDDIETFRETALQF
ncbi:MAG: winged helix-turn-helix domain-containing protein [Candidatus Omnitrophota bacterium]|nr:winged helix-turn-helix domain-containing protein [Candidatus Omnitrophota bacterium]